MFILKPIASHWKDNWCEEICSRLLDLILKEHFLVDLCDIIINIFLVKFLLKNFSCKVLVTFSSKVIFFRGIWSVRCAEFDIEEHGFGVPLPACFIKSSSKISKWKVKIQIQKIQISLRWVYFINFIVLDMLLASGLVCLLGYFLVWKAEWTNAKVISCLLVDC